MKRTTIIGITIIVLVLCLAVNFGCQKQGWEEKHTVSTRADDPEQKQKVDSTEVIEIVKKFTVSEDKTVPEMIQFFEGNLDYTTEKYKTYTEELISYYQRVDKALDVFKTRYVKECSGYLSEEGCTNALDPRVAALLIYPKETVQKMEVVEQTEEKASVQVVTVSEAYAQSIRAETYYLKKTEDGWKVYDVFDFNAKKAISDVDQAGMQNEHNLQVFRLRSKLEDVKFDGDKYAADVCVDKLGDDYLFTSENNKNALDCYNKEYFTAAKDSGDTSHCRMIFPARYSAICYGMTYANNGMNCTQMLSRPAYRSEKYGYLTTGDICNFYYSMEKADKDLNMAIANCVNIKNQPYLKKCVQVLTPKEEIQVTA